MDPRDLPPTTVCGEARPTAGATYSFSWAIVAAAGLIAVIVGGAAVAALGRRRIAGTGPGERIG